MRMSVYVLGSLVAALSVLPVTAGARTIAPQCHVVGDTKQLVSAGGAKAVCAAIAKAGANRSVNGFSVEVRVAPRAHLIATVSLADGRRLDPLEMAEMDRGIMPPTLTRLARAIVDQVAGATH